MLLCFFLSLGFFFQEEPYVLILTNQQRLEIKEAPRIEGRLCYITLLNGEVTSLPAKVVDLETTRAYNEDLQATRLAEKAAAEEREREAQELKEKQAKKVISLTADEGLPSYDRTEGSVSGVAADAEDAELIGDPNITNFSSDEPVFLAQEKIYRYKDHYKIEGQVRVNSATGAAGVKVFLKVKYADGSEESLEQSLTSRLSFGDTATVEFNLSSGLDIMQTSYSISGNLTTDN